VAVLAKATQIGTEQLCQDLEAELIRVLVIHLQLSSQAVHADVYAVDVHWHAGRAALHVCNRWTGLPCCTKLYSVAPCWKTHQLINA